MKLKDIDEFEAVEAQLSAVRDELLVLVKKSPHDALSAFKLTVVNGLLRRANTILSAKERPISDFAEFATEALPSSSDVVLIIGQYLAALENFRSKRISETGIDEWYWDVDDRKDSRRTYPRES